MEPMKVVLAVLVVSVVRASDIDTSVTCAAGDGACSTVESDNKTLTKAPVMMQLAGEITKRAVSQKESGGRVEIGTANAVNDVKEKMKDERMSVTDFEGEMMDTKGGNNGPEPKVWQHTDALIKYPEPGVIIAWADFGRDVVAGGAASEDVFYVDAGSSGNHLFAYLADGKWVTKEANYEAKCSDKTKIPNKGLAAMGLPRLECKPTFTYQTYDASGCTSSKWVHDDQSYDDWSNYHVGLDEEQWWERYRKTIFGGLYDNWEKGVDEMEASKLVLPDNRDSGYIASRSWDKCQRRFANIEKIPIVATAGMRLVSQKVNKQVWGNICGKNIVIGKNKCPEVKQETTMKFAPAGVGSCGTIPGTQEAFFEWGAHVSYQIKTGKRKLSGTFTMGGASAQIAIPLIDEKDMKEFASLIERVKVDEDFDCNKMRLPLTKERAPWFNNKSPEELCPDDPTARIYIPNPVNKPKPCTGCLDDYISMKTFDEVHSEFPANSRHFLREESSSNSGPLPPPRIQGLGLVSFLGLAGNGLVAGGGDQIKVWAQDNKNKQKCGDEGVAQDCAKQLRDTLNKDVLWKHVTKHFATNFLDIEKFYFDTKASDPNLVLKGLPTIEGKEGRGFVPKFDKFNDDKEIDAAYILQRELTALCKHDGWNKYGFGYKKGVNCIRAYWTSLYTTAFFAPTPGWQAAVGLK